MSTEEILTELFKRGQLIRDSWWSAYKANLDRLGAELRANESFVGDYGHLVATLPEAPQMPFQTDHYPSPPPGQSYGAPPPPLPQSPEERDEALRLWEQTFGRMPNGYRGEGNQ